MGQRFILLLAEHPNFIIHTLGASSSSTGKTYKKAVLGRWKQSRAVPAHVADLEMKECVAKNFAQCDVVFSGLDSGPASTVGECLLLSAQLGRKLTLDLGNRARI